MLKLGPGDIANYPFLADASESIKSLGFTLEQIGTDPDILIIIETAMNRIRAATDGRIFETLDGSTSSRRVMLETLSFLVAIILLKLSGMQTLIRRFALAEARRAEKNLERDLSGRGADRLALAKYIMNEFFSIDIKLTNSYMCVPVVDYVEHAVLFHEKAWDLSQRTVVSGDVQLTSHETVRMIRAEVGSYIQTKIRKSPKPTMYKNFEGPVAELTKLAKRFFTAPVETSGKYPPCITRVIETLERGENVPHSGRFMLATYLLKRGLSVEDVAALFRNAPDYNERITMYQVNNLATGGAEDGYNCPSCEKIRDRDLCFPDNECRGIFTPLHYGRRK